MARSVVPGDAGPVQCEHNGQPVQPDVQVGLIEGAAEKCRVNGHHWAEPTHGHAHGRGDRCLLCDPDIETAVRPALAEWDQSRRPRHGRRYGDHVVALISYFDYGLAERQRVARYSFGRLGGASGRVESPGVMKALFFIVFGRPVTAPFLGQDVDDNGRPVVRGSLTEGLFHSGDVVPVERAYVAHTERLEKRRRLNDFSDRRVETLQARVRQAPDFWQIPHLGFDPAPGRTYARMKPQPGKAAGKTRNGGHVRTAIVIEDHDDTASRCGPNC